jgi:hypothetical protein
VALALAAALGTQLQLGTARTLALTAAVALLATYLLFRKPLKRLWYVLNLFDLGLITENFRSATEKGSGFPWRSAAASPRAAPFDVPQQGSSQALPEGFSLQGVQHNVEAWIEEHCVTGLVVLQIPTTIEALCVHERYRLGNDVESRCISWSCGKSVQKMPRFRSSSGTL